jgi:hypothetical protein
MKSQNLHRSIKIETTTNSLDDHLVVCITRGGTVHIPLASSAMSRQVRTRQVMPTLHTVKREGVYHRY